MSWAHANGLRDHLERGALDLSFLRVAVLDEADEMLDMGFHEELEEILNSPPRTRRTLALFCDNAAANRGLRQGYQRDALRIETLGDNEGHQDIAYQAVAVSPTDIEHAAVNLLRFHEAETAILFCATREAVRRLHASLAERGFRGVALRENTARMNAIRRSRHYATSAPGYVSPPTLQRVGLTFLQFRWSSVELPRDAEALQHRSGRTARPRKGTAVLIVPFQRRKKVEAMLRGARIDAEWISVPSAPAIRGKDRERLLAALSFPSNWTKRTGNLPDS